MRNIIHKYSFYIMKKSIDDTLISIPSDLFHLQSISYNDIDELKNESFGSIVMRRNKKYFKKYRAKCGGFKLISNLTNELTGYFFYMFRGGRDSMFKFRKYDMYLRNIY